MNNLITMKQVQEILGVGKDWLYQRVRSGEIPSYKLGRYVRFKRVDIEALLEKNKQSNPPEQKDRA